MKLLDGDYIFGICTEKNNTKIVRRNGTKMDLDTYHLSSASWRISPLSLPPTVAPKKNS
jgi:hypothetical protein